jgi:adenylate cyclase
VAAKANTAESLISLEVRTMPIRPSQPASAAEGIAREEISGLAYMFWARLVALGLLAVWVVLSIPFERSGLYLVAIAAFALLGAPPYLLARRGRGGIVVTAAFLLLDAALLTYLLIVPPPFFVEGWTPQLNLRLPNFLYLGVFLVGMALSYSPILVAWTGVASIAAWTAGFLWVAGLPEAIPHSSRDMLDGGLSGEAVIAKMLNPRAVSLTVLSNQIVFLVLITTILALTVWRSRRLVRRQVSAEAERAALARYFSPNIVHELSAGGRALDQPTVQPVAVLFADMVGFTAVSERLQPEALMALLREFLGRLARITFAHDGTIDKYMGDAIMVHFGTPRPQGDDPVRALACAAAMVSEVRRWNDERKQAGEPEIGIGIGVHYGDVLVGNIGDAQRLEYTVLGDTVNVASRLERLTRETGTPLVVSEDLVAAVRRCGVDAATMVEGLRRDQARTVRGRREPVAIWCAAPAAEGDGAPGA